MKYVILLFIFLLLTFNVLYAGKEVNMESPSNKLKVDITTSETGLRLRLFINKEQVAEADIARFEFKSNFPRKGYAIGNINGISNPNNVFHRHVLSAWNVFGED